MSTLGMSFYMSQNMKYMSTLGMSFEYRGYVYSRYVIFEYKYMSTLGMSFYMSQNINICLL